MYAGHLRSRHERYVSGRIQGKPQFNVWRRWGDIHSWCAMLGTIRDNSLQSDIIIIYYSIQICSGKTDLLYFIIDYSTLTNLLVIVE